MKKFNLVWEVPSAVVLTSLSGMFGVLTVMDLIHPEIPTFFLPTPYTAALSISTGIGAHALWMKIIKPASHSKNEKQ